MSLRNQALIYAAMYGISLSAALDMWGRWFGFTVALVLSLVCFIQAERKLDELEGK